MKIDALQRQDDRDPLLRSSEQPTAYRTNEIRPNKGVRYLDTFLASPDFIAIGIVFFSSAIFQKFVDMPLQDFAEESLGATHNQIAAIKYSRALPYMLRIIFGVLSDVHPIGIRHRKPYLVLGVAVTCISTTVVAIMTSNVSSKNTSITVEILCTILFVASLGDSLATLMAGVMILEHSHMYETKDNRGAMQASALVSHFCGKVVGGIASVSITSNGFFLQQVSISTIFSSIAGGCALLYIPSIITLVDCRLVTRRSFRDDDDVSIWQSLRQDITALSGKVINVARDRIVQKLFILLYAISALQMGNPAWATFLSSSLSYATRDIQILDILGNVASLATVGVFQSCFSMKYDKLLLVLGILSAGLVNLTLLASLSNGTMDILFFQDGIIVSIITVVSYAGGALQLCVLYRYFIEACGNNGQYSGVLYSILTSLLMFGSAASKGLGAQLKNNFDVSHVTLGMHDYGDFRRLTFFCSFVPIVPVAGTILLFPKNYQIDLICAVDSGKKDDGSFHSGKALALFYVAALILAVTILELSAADVADEYP